MADQIIDDYMSSLADLTFNSKPHINMLTMVAEENIKYAEAIVKVIEHHLQQAKPVHMLPVLYLMDSIVKNIQQADYKELFAKNLESTFCGVFEKVDEKTRQAMFKLRQTWPEIFPNSKLYSLDIGVQQLDPAWPVTASPPEAKPKGIHVNPKFLKQRQDEEAMRLQAQAEAAAAAAKEAEKERLQQEMAAHALVQKQLFEKQQELLRLQQQKLEMELLEAKEKIAQQKRELEMKEHQLRLDEAMKLKTRDEENERQAKIKRDQERASQLRQEQEKAEALRRELETKAAAIKQKAAANRKEFAAATAQTNTDASKDLRMARDPRLNREKQDLPKPAAGAKIATPASRMDDTELQDEETSLEPEKTPEPQPEKKGMNDHSKKDNKKSSTSGRTQRSGRNTRNSDKIDTKKSSGNEKPSEKNSSKSNHSPRKPARRPSTRSYRSKRASESPDTTKVATPPKRSRSKSPRRLHRDDKSKGHHDNERDRRRHGNDHKRGSSKDKDEPPAKMAKSEPGDNKENKKLPDDLAELFGTEDQDYRQLNTSGDRLSEGMVSPGGHSAGWARFKASRPEEFPFSQPRTSKDIDMRSPPADLLSPTFPRFDSPEDKLKLQKPMMLESAEDIRKEGQMLLEAGKLTQDQYQELLKQLDQLVKLQQLKQQLKQKASGEGNTQQMDAAEKAFDEHSLRLRETMGQIGSRTLQDRRPDSLAARSPLFNDPRSRGAPAPRGPQYIKRRDSYQGYNYSRQNTRDPSKPLWEMMDGIWELPYDTSQFYIPEHDPRWFVPSEGPEVLHEVVIDGRGWDLPFANISRPIKVGSVTVSIKANPVSREVSINDQVYYRVGEPVRSIMFHGYSHTIYYHGPVKKIWINGFMYEVQSDAPPMKIIVENEEHWLRIDSIDNNVIVDGHIVCQYGDVVDSLLIAGKTCSVQFVPPAKQILIDGTLCELDFTQKYPCVYIKGKEHGIRFDGPGREIIINGKPWTVQVDRPRKARFGSARVHILGLGGPGHEIIIDGKWYEVKFNGPEKQIQVGPRLISIQLVGPPPEVKILGEFVNDPEEIEKLSQGYFIDPSIAIDTVIKVAAPFGSVLMPGEAFQPPMQGGMGPERFGRFECRGKRGNDPRFWGPRQPFLEEQPFNEGPRSRYTDMQHGHRGGRGQRPFGPGRGQFQVRMRGMRPPRFQGHADMGHPFMGPPSMDNNYDDGGPLMSSGQPQVDVNDLFSKLLQAGIINKEEQTGRPVDQDESSQPAPSYDVFQLLNNVKANAEKPDNVDEVPDLTEISVDKLKVEHKGVYQRLYSGIQCSSCGVRFITQDTSKYREHLDWHYRQNKKDKDKVKVLKFRRWYYTMLEWIQFEEITEYDERAQSAYFEKMAQSSQSQQSEPAPAAAAAAGNRDADTITSCPVAGNAEDDVCDICGDPFEQFWSEETEEWHLKDAIRADGKTYHPVCYEDYRETSMMETPTPDQGEEHPFSFVAETNAQNSEELSKVKPVPAEEASPSLKPASPEVASPKPESPKPESPKPASPKPASPSPAAAEALQSPEPAVPSPAPQPVEAPQPLESEALLVDSLEDDPKEDTLVDFQNNSQEYFVKNFQLDDVVESQPIEIEPVEQPSSPASLAGEQSSSPASPAGEQSPIKLKRDDVADVSDDPGMPDADSPDIMLNIEPLASPKTPLQDEPPTPESSPPAVVVPPSLQEQMIMSRLSLLNKEVLTCDPMALVTQELNESEKKVSSARVSPVAARVSPVTTATSAPSSAHASPTPQSRSPPTEGQPIRSVCGVFSRRFYR